MDVIIKYFVDNGVTSIDQTPYTWNQLGAMYGITGNAARKRWKKYNRATPMAKAITAAVNGFEPKILVFDIETAPMKAYVWKIWEENVNPLNGQLTNEWFMLSWSAKWLFDENVISDVLTPDEVLAEDDKRITQSVWNMLNEADIIIGHNIERYDVKRLNTRFFKHGLKLPMPYKTIDTLGHAKKRFSLTSNKLDYAAQFIGIGKKTDTGGFELWKQCLQGNQDALTKMDDYCKDDVKLTEELYLAMRPYIQPHPNLGLYITEDTQCCPSCTSKDLNWQGTFTTYTNSYKAFRCNNCGSIGRDKIPQKKHLNLTKPIPV